MADNDFIIRKKKDISHMLNKGMEFLNNNDYAQALQLFKRAVELRPKSKDALNTLADFYKRLGEFDEAKKCYSRIIQNYPLDTETYIMRSTVNLNNGEYVEALIDVNMAIMYQSEDTDLLLLRADIYSSLELWGKAIEEYTNIYENTAIKAEALLGRGYCYESKGDFQTAVKDFTRAIEMVPDDYIFYCHRSICYLRIDKIHNAIADAEKSVELGEYPESYYCRALSYACAEKPQQALLDVKTTLDLDTFGALNLEKHFLNEPGFYSLQTSPRYKGLLENHFGVEIPGLADETIKTAQE